MKWILFLAALSLSSCTFTVKPEPDLVAKVDQHQLILSAIANYIGELQEKGVLPKPEPKKE